MRQTVDFEALFRALPGLYLVVLPDAPRYTITAVSDAYARGTKSECEEILERGFFDVFPDSMLGASLARVLSTRVPDVMAVEERANRWWLQTSSPVLGPDGEVAYIIHAIEDVTEKRQRDTVSLANSPFDHASDSIFIADTDGRFTDVNATACEMLGYSREELIGKTIVDIIPPEDVPRLAATRKHLLESGMVDVAEWTQLKKNGTPITVDVSTKILPDGRWEAFVRDISERKRIETELRDANAFLDAIIENIPLMLFIKESTSLRFVRFNRAGEALLGWPREKLVGKNDFDFWPKEQAEFFVEKDRETMAAGHVVDIVDEPIKTRHLGTRILHTKKVPILGPSGEPLYLLGISEDITERKRLEEERQLLADVNFALSGSLDYEQTLSTMTELAVQRVADWCTIDLMEEHGNLRRLKVASADPADAELCATLEKMPPDRDLPNLPQFIADRGGPFLVEHVTPELVDTFGQGPEHIKALLATGVTSFIGLPLLVRGKTLGVLLFGSIQRAYTKDDLRWAQAVADRSAVAIENARLYRASIEASQLRDQVLGVVAHDLRNPLATILLQESILAERRGSKRELGVIHRAATRMNRLIEDLLDVSLLEAGQLRLQKGALSARDLVIEGVELERTLAAAVKLEIELGSDADVWGDHDRLLQVLENLISNAIKFTTPGGRITVGTESKHREVVFWVADEGRGIAADALPHVFERFWQATRGDRRGVGLGLPIVKGIVEAHGGHVWVESTLGRGTTFYFSVPAADPAPERQTASIH